MDMLKNIKRRRSVRRYRKKPVPSRMVRKILEAGRWAPSGLNNQPWRFVIVRNIELKGRLSRLTESVKVIIASDLIICVCLDRDAVYNRVKDVQSIGACIQNMLLEADSLGLGACWLGEILNSGRAVIRALGLPGRYELMASIALGWPEKNTGKGKRKRLEDLILKVCE